MEMPETEFIEGALSLRKLRLPSDTQLTKRGLVRWCALSLGLISPGETRLSILSILDSLLYYGFRNREAQIDELKDYIANKSVFKNEMNEKTLRYHLTQLKKDRLVHGKRGKFALIRNPFSDEVGEGITYWMDLNSKEIGERIKRGMDYIKKAYQGDINAGGN